MCIIALFYRICQYSYCFDRMPLPAHTYMHETPPFICLRVHSSCRIRMGIAPSFVSARFLRAHGFRGKARVFG